MDAGQEPKLQRSKTTMAAWLSIWLVSGVVGIGCQDNQPQTFPETDAPTQIPEESRPNVASPIAQPSASAPPLSTTASDTPSPSPAVSNSPLPVHPEDASTLHPTDAGGVVTDAGTLTSDAAESGGEPPVNLGPLRVMPMGDSITYGSVYTANAGYRGPLHNLLVDAGYDVLFVGPSVEGRITTDVRPLPVEQQHHAGFSSYAIQTISNNLDGLDTSVFERHGGAQRDPQGGHWFDGIDSGPNERAAIYPDVITLMVGTNDARRTDRDVVHAELRSLIAKITSQRPEADLIVAQITPSNRPSNESYNQTVVDEVERARAMGLRVSMVDLHSEFPGDGMSPDGVHPNDIGFEFMAQHWFDAVIDTPNAQSRHPLP